MALPKLFQRIFWHNNTEPALAEDNLNAMSKGISDIDDRLINIASGIMADLGNVTRAEAAAEQAGEYMQEAKLFTPEGYQELADDYAYMRQNLSGEISARASADTLLQSQIDELIAPSGEAPSAAEVQNARMGIDGTYNTLGNAVRNQINNTMRLSGQEVGITTAQSGYYMSKYNTSFLTANDSYNTNIYTISPNKKYLAIAQASGGGNVALISICNSVPDKKVVIANDSDYVAGDMVRFLIDSSEYDHVAISTLIGKPAALIELYDKTNGIAPYSVVVDKFLRNTGVIDSVSGLQYALFSISPNYKYDVHCYLTGGGSVVPIALADSTLTHFKFLATSLNTANAHDYNVQINANEYLDYSYIICSNALYINTCNVYRESIETDGDFEIIAPDSFTFSKYLRNDGTGINNLSGVGYASYDIDATKSYRVICNMSGGAAIVPIAIADADLSKFIFLADSVGSLHRYEVKFNAAQYAGYTKLILSKQCINNSVDSFEVYESVADTDKFIDGYVKIAPTSTIVGKYINKLGSGIVSPSTANPDFKVALYVVNPKKKYRALASMKGGNNVALICLSDSTVTNYKVLATGTPSDFSSYDIEIFTDEYPYIAMSTLVNTYGTLELYESIEDIAIDDVNYQLSFVPKEDAATETNTVVDLTNLTGKDWNAVGDSLTNRMVYVNKVCTRLGLTGHNCGLSASTIAINNRYLTDSSMVERVLGLNGNTPYAQADLWTILGGFNDVNYDTPIGDITSTDMATVYGALKAICNYIRRESNNPKLLLITPTHSFLDQTKPKQMQAVVKAIKEVGELYAAPVIDLYNNSGITYCNLLNVTEDRLHWNAIGDVMVYPLIANGIKNCC